MKPVNDDLKLSRWQRVCLFLLHVTMIAMYIVVIWLMATLSGDKVPNNFYLYLKWSVVGYTLVNLGVCAFWFFVIRENSKKKQESNHGNVD